MSDLTFDEILEATKCLPMKKELKVERSQNSMDVDVITDHFGYHISAHVPTPERDERSYLGCIARHPETGQGNDLPDGDLGPDILNEILWEIECYDAFFSGVAVSDSDRWDRWAKP